MKTLISTAMAFAALTISPADATDRNKEYLKAQRKAKVECAVVRDFGRSLNAQYPKPHGEWGSEQLAEVSCIDKVTEIYVELNPKKIRVDELTGRFLGLQRRESHKDLCKMSMIQKLDWSIWVTYQSKLGRPIATTRVSKKSCKEYGFPRVAQS